MRRAAPENGHRIPEAPCVLVKSREIGVGELEIRPVGDDFLEGPDTFVFPARFIRADRMNPLFLIGEQGLEIIRRGGLFRAGGRGPAAYPRLPSFLPGLPGPSSQPGISGPAKAGSSSSRNEAFPPGSEVGPSARPWSPRNRRPSRRVRGDRRVHVFHVAFDEAFEGGPSRGCRGLRLWRSGRSGVSPPSAAGHREAPSSPLGTGIPGPRRRSERYRRARCVLPDPSRLQTGRRSDQGTWRVAL